MGDVSARKLKTQTGGSDIMTRGYGDEKWGQSFIEINYGQEVSQVAKSMIALSFLPSSVCGSYINNLIRNYDSPLQIFLEEFSFLAGHVVK